MERESDRVMPINEHYKYLSNWPVSVCMSILINCFLYSIFTNSSLGKKFGFSLSQVQSFRVEGMKQKRQKMLFNLLNDSVFERLQLHRNCNLNYIHIKYIRFLYIMYVPYQPESSSKCCKRNTQKGRKTATFCGSFRCEGEPGRVSQPEYGMRNVRFCL